MSLSEEHCSVKSHFSMACCQNTYEQGMVILHFDATFYKRPSLFASFNQVCQTIAAFLRLVTCKIHIYIGACGLETVIANVIPALKESEKVVVPPQLLLTLQKMKMNLSNYFSCNSNRGRITIHTDYLLDRPKMLDEEIVVIQKETKYSPDFEHYKKIQNFHIFKIFAHPSDADCNNFHSLVSPVRSIPLYDKDFESLEETVDVVDEAISKDHCNFSTLGTNNCLIVKSSFDREKVNGNINGLNTHQDEILHGIFSKTKDIPGMDTLRGLLKRNMTSSGTVTVSNTMVVEKKGRYESFTSFVTPTSAMVVQSNVNLSSSLPTLVLDDDDSDVEIIETNGNEVIEIDDDDDEDISPKEMLKETKPVKTELHKDSSIKHSAGTTNLSHNQRSCPEQLESLPAKQPVGRTDPLNNSECLPTQQNSAPSKCLVGDKVDISQVSLGMVDEVQKYIKNSEMYKNAVDSDTSVHLLESQKILEKLNATLRKIVNTNTSSKLLGGIPSSASSDLDVGGPQSLSQPQDSNNLYKELNDDNSQPDYMGSLGPNSPQTLTNLEKEGPVKDPAVGPNRPAIPFRKCSSAARTRGTFKARPRVRLRAAVPFERDTFYDICFLNTLYPHYDLPILKFNNRDIFNNPDYYHNFGQCFASGLSRDQVFQLDDQISQPVVVLERL